MYARPLMALNISISLFPTDACLRGNSIELPPDITLSRLSKRLRVEFSLYSSVKWVKRSKARYLSLIIDNNYN